MAFPFLFGSAVVPSLLLIWFFHARDLYPEPQRVVWTTFALGVLTTLPAIVIELLVDGGLKPIADPMLEGWLQAFLSAALTEESLKYAVVFFYCMRHKEFDEPMDGIVYGAIASLGFATLENCLYVTEGGEGTAIFRAFTAVPAHACMGAIMGYFIGQAKFRPWLRRSLLAKAFLFPFLIHGAYDGPLLALVGLTAHKHKASVDPMAEAGPFLVITFAALLFGVIWTLVLSSRLRREQKSFMASQWDAYRARRPPPSPPWAPIPSGYGPKTQASLAFAAPFAPSPPPQAPAGTQVVPRAPGSPWANEAPPVPVVPRTQLAQQWEPKTEQMLAPPVHRAFAAGANPPEALPARGSASFVPPGSQVPFAPAPQGPQEPASYPMGAPRGPAAYAPMAHGPHGQPGFHGYGQRTPPDMVAWALVGFGALLASGGGLMMLGAIALLVSGSTRESRVLPILAAGVFVGLVPLALGALLFGLGVRRLARQAPVPPPAAFAYGG